MTKSTILGEEELRLRKQRRDFDPLSGNLLSLLRRQASDLSVAELMGATFYLIDTFFAGLISTEVLAAIILAAPLAHLAGIGSQAVRLASSGMISSAIGAGDKEEARVAAVQGTVANILLSLISTALLLLFGRSCLSALGASGETLDLAAGYLVFIALSIFPDRLSDQFVGILTSHSRTDLVRNWSVSAVLLNIILDPLFVFGGFGIPPMGIIGLAVATTIISIIGAVFTWFYVTRLRLLRLHSWKDLLPERRYFTALILVGVPIALSSSAAVGGQFVLFHALTRWGDEEIAAFGIASRILTLLVLPAVGLAPATYYIVAQCYGARLLERIRGCWFYAIGLAAIYLLPAFFFALLPDGFGIALFSDDAGVLVAGSKYLTILFLGELGGMIALISGCVLLGIDRSRLFAVVDSLRSLFLPLVFISYLTARCGGAGVGWTVVIAETAAAVINIFLVFQLIRPAAVKNRQPFE